MCSPRRRPPDVPPAAVGAVRPYAPAAAFGIVVVLVLANMSPLFQGQFVDKNLERPEALPSYMKQSANYMDGQGDATRVLELPGADFSHYRWGATLDPAAARSDGPAIPVPRADSVRRRRLPPSC